MSAAGRDSSDVTAWVLVKWLGVDFSGSAAMWGRRCGVSNVWIAELAAGPDVPTLISLRRVQELEGSASPFDRLRRLLDSHHAAAGIDAPFSVPAERVPASSHRALLEAVRQWDRGGRIFATGQTLVEALAPEVAPRGIKEYRQAERIWRVNVRSTLWAGPRGGAAMTAACLTLLAELDGPLWPWIREGRGLLVETFPAAQLKAWGLPHQRYNGSDAVAVQNRRRILAGLRSRCDWTAIAERTMLACADALDALLCGLAARAVTVGALKVAPPPGVEPEGWIAVHA